MRHLIFTVLLFLSLPVLAQAPLTGPVNLDGARIIALAAEPGSVDQADIMKTNGLPIYQFEITRESDGSLMYVAVDGATGRIVEHSMRKLGEGAALPAATYTQEAAEKKAAEYVAKEVFGTEKPVVKKFEYTQENGRPIYRVNVAKFFKVYDIIIDPFTGKMLAVRKQL